MIDPEEIERALITRLMSLSPQWSTKLPGIPFQPRADQAWQRGTVMPGRPETVAIGNGAYSRMVGLYQVDLFYPKSQQRTDLLFARAKAVRNWFFPTHRRGLALVAGAGEINIETLPGVSRLIETDPAHNQIYVEITFRVDDAPSA